MSGKINPDEFKACVPEPEEKTIMIEPFKMIDGDALYAALYFERERLIREGDDE